MQLNGFTASEGEALLWPICLRSPAKLYNVMCLLSPCSNEVRKPMNVGGGDGYYYIEPLIYRA